MDSRILELILELRDLTDEAFVYRQEAWAFSTRSPIKMQHIFSGNLPGFLPITKETEEEIIESFGLIRKLVGQLMEARETNKRLEVKMILNKK